LKRGNTEFRADGDASKHNKVEQRTNHHPTVKPTALMQYLIRLITPPGGVVCDPFMGSGSTGKAAMIEGVAFIGMEQDAAYFAIAEARSANAADPLRQMREAV
jgi:site-specific DNA-methyltransferase (adenine-specific)